MHMSDALISPVVGGVLWAATAGLAVHSARKVEHFTDDARVPLMGVLGAFVFAAQMVNFSIPATGSSGHLGGGLLLSILLGPHAAFLVMASVLTVQALFFADGGLLALGCNVFNLGFFTCFLVYPFLWKPVAGSAPTRQRLLAASLVAAVVGLQLGAMGVVLETTLSGISTLPFTSFVVLMQPIHLAIGIVEGLVTAAVVLTVRQARPEIVVGQLAGAARPMRPLMVGLAVAAALTAAVVSWFASAQPDGLEWSMAKVSGTEELATPEEPVHTFLARLQQATAFLPDYDFKRAEAAEAPQGEEISWPAPSAGTSVAGMIGALLVLAIAAATGYGLRMLRRRAVQS